MLRAAAALSPAFLLPPASCCLAQLSQRGRLKWTAPRPSRPEMCAAPSVNTVLRHRRPRVFNAAPEGWHEGDTRTKQIQPLLCSPRRWPQIVLSDSRLSPVSARFNISPRLRVKVVFSWLFMFHITAAAGNMRVLVCVSIYVRVCVCVWRDASGKFRGQRTHAGDLLPSDRRSEDADAAGDTWLLLGAALSPLSFSSSVGQRGLRREASCPSFLISYRLLHYRFMFEEFIVYTIIITKRPYFHNVITMDPNSHYKWMALYQWGYMCVMFSLLVSMVSHGKNMSLTGNHVVVCVFFVCFFKAHQHL